MRASLGAIIELPSIVLADFSQVVSHLESTESTGLESRSSEAQGHIIRYIIGLVHEVVFCKLVLAEVICLVEVLSW